MRLSLIAAVADNGVIGRAGRLPWHLPADLERFRRLTAGHWLLMGRRTYESIGRPLPERVLVVLTRRPFAAPGGVRCAKSLEQALELLEASGDAEPFVAGGAEVYGETLPRASRLYLTRVRAAVEGDTYFPELDWDAWRLVSEQAHPADARHAYPMSFRVYERRAGGSGDDP